MSEDVLAKLLGIDIEAERIKRKQEFTDYYCLLDTMTDEEFGNEIARRFGLDIHQAAIILALYAGKRAKPE